MSVSKPSAHEPTTTHTPSGSAPPRTWFTMGERCPMQSTTSRERTSAPLLVWSTAAPGRMRMLASGVFSSTTPPAASKRARASEISRSGRTPTLRTSLSQTSSPPGKPQRTGLNSMPMTSSASSSESTPASTSSITSLRDAFQSCGRPRSGPASSTATLKPLSTSAVASKMPMLPPQTTRSYSGVSVAAFGSSNTTSRTGGIWPARSLDQFSSSRSNPS